MTVMSSTRKDQNTEENSCKVGPVGLVCRKPFNYKKNVNDLDSRWTKYKA
jgi:hypothetical protein